MTQIQGKIINRVIHLTGASGVGKPPVWPQGAIVVKTIRQAFRAMRNIRDYHRCKDSNPSKGRSLIKRYGITDIDKHYQIVIEDI